MKKHIPFAIAYDFDGTLAPGNMQERDFIPAIGMNKKRFWDEVKNDSKKHEADNILIYMHLMLKKAEAQSVQVRKKDFEEFGKDLPFFEGVLPYEDKFKKQKGWFDRINEYGKHSNVAVDHFIISSGIREMVTGTKISKKFKAIFASSFCYDHHGVAKWPALALNYTSKTQFLFRINKGCLNVYEHKDINRYVPDKDRAVPFKNIIYIGDGETDIPCFRLVKDRGGNSVAVYKPHTPKAKTKSEEMFNDGRVNFIAPADFRDGTLLDRIVKSLIDKIQHDAEIYSLAKQLHR
ncbi:MAG: haloacid dehalogenase-like hydrolase [Melioribacteraceae bacterium]|nr:haloacid dehalogenase-like hydrolase [Melioribacteraceae bacterium]MCF8353566.1 haloacid dehalogenase-like hydrolase [Melioribacteraceae bacterium]MCF8393489.1 haloacid dehalogenase-like hydrolase [Melioribacteraceae bacterium]MCF8419299.1 haloacid dehalogenase-like hydrolase [Melioribacteraceae bacterium]